MKRRISGVASAKITADTLLIHAKELENLLREDFKPSERSRAEWRERVEAALTKFRGDLNRDAKTLKVIDELDDLARMRTLFRLT